MSKIHNIEINLLTRAEPISRSTWHGIIMAVLMATTVLAISTYWYCDQTAKMRQIREVNETLKKSISTYKAEDKRAVALQASEQEWWRKRAMVEKLRYRTESYSEFFNILELATPAQVQVVEVEKRGSRVLLSGFSADYYQVTRLIEGLRGEGGRVSDTEMDSSWDESRSQVKYSINMSWEGSKN